MAALAILFFSSPQASAQGNAWIEVEVSGSNEEPLWADSVLELTIDDLVIDYKETYLEEDGYRLYAPGTPHFGNAKLTLAPGPATDELYAWFQECSKGKNIRKNISVRLYKSDKTPGRGYNLLECFPVRWESPELDSNGTQKATETLTVNIGRIEMKTLDRVSPSPPGPVGVTVTDAGGSVAKDTWDSWSGGEPVLIVAAALGGAKYHTETPGHKTIDALTLRGAMTDGRKALCEWINDTVNGKPWKRTLAVREDNPITQKRPGRIYTYHDCFPVRYVFPHMSVTNTTGNTMEEVSIKPIRLELK